jgi:DNA-binding response OmpR family regulator
MKKILIIEDNYDILENIAETLELANYKVLKAEDGLTGVNLAMKEKPDLIVCDIRMPALDGYGVLYLLSKNEEVAGTPFIFMTAKSDKEDIRKGMGMGADDYITKPFDGIELLDAVETRLKKIAMYSKDNSNNMSGLSSFLSNDNSLQLLHEVVNKEDVDTRFCKKKEIIYMDGFYPKGIY